jgi:hypothetical protein
MVAGCRHDSLLHSGPQPGLSGSKARITMPRMGLPKWRWWTIGLLALACGGGAGQQQSAGDAGSGAGGNSGSGATNGTGNTGNTEPGYLIELQSGLGGPKGRCELNWCRDNMCRFICLAVPDDEESCNQAITAYEGIPRQNFIMPRFVETTVPCDTAYDGPLCQDEFGGTYYAYNGGDCLHGDQVAAASGACHYEFCVGADCKAGCEQSTKPTCDRRAAILMMNEDVTSSSTSFLQAANCPDTTPGTGGTSGSGGTSSSGGSAPAGDPCGDCLTECADLPGCCSGEGCSCETACMPSSCTEPYQLCCNAYFCLCLETC